jgi:hypothetical protein
MQAFDVRSVPRSNPASSVSGTAMIVLERGGEWPAHIDGLTDVVGLSSEADDLLERTRKKLEALRSSNRAVRVAVLACNSATCDGSPRRESIARTLLGAVTNAPRGRLILTANEAASTPLRAELLTLAEELRNAARGSSASVSVWFTEPAHDAPPRGRSSEWPRACRLK